MNIVAITTNAAPSIGAGILVARGEINRHNKNKTPQPTATSPDLPPTETPWHFQYRT